MAVGRPMGGGRRNLLEVWSRTPQPCFGAREELPVGCVIFSCPPPNRQGLKLQRETCGGGRKAATLFCSLRVPGVKHLLSEGTVSGNGLALCKAPHKTWGLQALKPPQQCHSSIPGPVRGPEALPGPQVPFHSISRGVACPSRSPGRVGSSSRDFESGKSLSLVTGWGVPGHTPPASHPGAATKGGVGRLIGVSFPSCDCWSGRGEIKSGGPAAVRIPGLSFIS